MQEENQKTQTVAEVAVKYLEAGLCTLPIHSPGIKLYDGRVTEGKEPTIAWKKFQSRLPSIDEVKGWFNGIDRIAVICGQVSGNLELIDFDHKVDEAWPAWQEAIRTASPELYNRLVIEQSPSGGVHVWYRCPSKPDGNDKLARTIVFPSAEEIVTKPGGKKEVRIKRKGYEVFQHDGKDAVVLTMIETRGEGGYGCVHPTPNYEMKRGSFLSIPLVTAGEHELLVSTARMLNEFVDTKEIKADAVRKQAEFADKKPGEAFCERGDITALLLKAGWSPAGDPYWTRPGKDSGISASVQQGCFYVFSSSAHPFDAGAHSFFSVYAKLECNGDYSEAAKQLAAQGYGDAMPKKADHSKKEALETFIETPEEPTERATIPGAPSNEEVVDLYRGTCIEAWVNAVNQVAPIHPMLSMTAAFSFQSILLCRCVRIRGRTPNMHVMLAAPTSSGKGTNTELYEKVATSFNIVPYKTASTKYLLKRLIGPNPWSALIINEFSQFLRPGYYLNDTLNRIIEGYDGNLSDCSENSGSASVKNAGVGLLACCQPEMLINRNTMHIFNQGFFARTLVGIEDTQRPEFRPLPIQGPSTCADQAPVIMAFRQAYDWLPPAMIPSNERMIVKDNEETGTGEWVHPTATTNLTLEPYKNVFQQHTLHAELFDSMNRLVPHYLPQLAIPFCHKSALKSGIITADAQARAERLMLKYYWALHEVMRLTPDDDSEILCKRLIAKIKNCPGIPGRNLQRIGGYGDVRKYHLAIEVLIARGQIRYEQDGRTRRYWLTDRPSATMENLGKFEAKIEVQKQPEAVDGDGLENI